MTTNLDERTALSDRAVSYLRTIVPVLWGSIAATILRVISPHLPGDVGQALTDLLGSQLVLTLVLTAAIALWYWAWRRLERRIPDWLVRLVLGSARTPGYTLPDAVVQLDDGTAVTGVLPTHAALPGVGGYDYDSRITTIDAAEGIVERLIAIGWRPTSATLTSDERANLASLAATLDEGDPGRTALERILE